MRRSLFIAILLGLLVLSGCAQATWQPLWSTPMPGYSVPALSPSTSAESSTSMQLLEFFQKDVAGMTAPRMLVLKSKRVLEIYDGDTLMARMPVALGSDPEGPKTKDGDGKTPEGTYYICASNAYSKHYKSLCINYPNEEDALRGFGLGLLTQGQFDAIVNASEAEEVPNWKTQMGGEIAIHGQGEDAKGKTGDWTAGNIAVTDEQMDYIWKYIQEGTEVTIEP